MWALVGLIFVCIVEIIDTEPKYSPKDLFRLFVYGCVLGGLVPFVFLAGAITKIINHDDWVE